MPSHHKLSGTSDKRKKDFHSDRGPSGDRSEPHRTLRKHKDKSIASGMPYESQQPESPHSTYAPPTGNPTTPPKQAKTVRWGGNQYAAASPYVAETQYDMAENEYLAPGKYYMPNKFDPTNEKQDPVQFALDAMLTGPYPVNADTLRHVCPVRQDPHYSESRPKSPSLEFGERHQARASAGHSSSYGKTPSSNTYADELRKQRKKNRS